MEVHLPNNFTPRAFQAAVMRYFDEGGKRAFCAWHRRAGKDLGAIHQTCKMMHVKKGTYWHFFPTRAQAKRSIWEGHTKSGERILEQCFPGFTNPKRPGSIVRKKNESDLSIELKNGSIWRLMGTDKTEFVGAGPQGVVFSEFAQSRPKAWDLVRPMLRESGGWAWFITTPRGRNHAFKLFKDASKPGSGWFCDTKTVHQTGLTYASNKDGVGDLGPEAMMAEELAEGMAQEMIDQEYKVDWTAANIGAIYGKFMTALELRQALDVEFEHPVDGVHTSWDLGVSDSTSIWFWRLSGDAVDFIDFYENHGQAAEHYFEIIREKGYRYETHWLPHDARARTLVTGTSFHEEAVKELAAKHTGAVAIGPQLSLRDGIGAGRWLLQRPSTRFHKRCEDGVNALRAYEYEYDEDTKTFSTKPKHDWSSHPSDAFRYGAIVRKIALSMQPSPPPPSHKPDVRPLNKSMTLDELFEANQAAGGRERV